MLFYLICIRHSIYHQNIYTLIHLQYTFWNDKAFTEKGAKFRKKVNVTQIVPSLKTWPFVIFTRNVTFHYYTPLIIIHHPMNGSHFNEFLSLVDSRWSCYPVVYRCNGIIEILHLHMVWTVPALHYGVPSWNSETCDYIVRYCGLLLSVCSKSIWCIPSLYNFMRISCNDYECKTFSYIIYVLIFCFE